MSRADREVPPPSPEDGEAQGKALVALARASVSRALGVPAPETDSSAPWLRKPGATFVTLMKGDQLRGCVGTLTAHRPLAEDVQENARAAALRDDRFPPLSREELPEVRFEVSLLTPSVPLPRMATEADAIAHLRPGRDGVVLEMHGHRATFLPQVWEQIPDPKTFLAHLKHKAGLPKDFWSPELRISVYEVEKWKEEGDEEPSP